MPLGVCDCLVLVLWLSNGTRITTPPLHMEVLGDPMYDDNIDPGEERYERVAAAVEPHGLLCTVREIMDETRPNEIISCQAYVGDYELELGRQLPVSVCPSDANHQYHRSHVTDRINPPLSPDVEAWIHATRCNESTPRRHGNFQGGKLARATEY